VNRAKLLLLLLALVWVWPLAAREPEEPLLQVYSRDGGEYLDASPLPLHGEEWRWLQERERLILGVPRPDNPPMDITLRANAYEGVTADIVGMLTHLLHIEILVKGYPSRAAAIEALQRGEIDLLSTSNSYEREQHLLLTDKYIADDPAIYKNIQVKEREIRTIAVPEYYLPFMDIMRYLSDYKIKIYPSRYSALQPEYFTATRMM